MKRILLNYNYDAGLGTTASYIEKVLKERTDVEVFRLGEKRTPCADIYLNIEPCREIIRYPGRKVAYWEIDNHINRGSQFEKYSKVDYLFLAQKTWDEFYPMENKFWVPLAADPDIHKPYDDEEIEFDIGFIGNDNYPRRRALLDLIGKKYHLLRTTTKPREEYARMFSRCKMIFNCAMDRDINMRFFEGISMERMLLTDHVDGQRELFLDGLDYVTYNDWPDLDQKIEFYLNNPKEREIIAKSGRRHLKMEHTYADRVAMMLEIMGEN